MMLNVVTNLVLNSISLRSDCVSKIKAIRTQNVNNVIAANVNINCFSSKFDDLKVLRTGMFDILVTTEVKLGITFSVWQFHIDGFSIPCILDRNRNEGGVTVVREDIPIKLLSKHSLKEEIEGLFVEINFRKCKWLLGRIYNPPSQPDQYFF